MAGITKPDGVFFLDPQTGEEKAVCAENHTLAPYEMIIAVSPYDKNDLCKNTKPVEAYDHSECIKLDGAYSMRAENGNILRAEYSYVSGANRLPVTNLKLPAGYGKLSEKYTLEWGFHADIVPKEAVMYVEMGDVRKIYINGEDYTERFAACRLWGLNNRRAEISGALKQGENQIVLCCEMPDWSVPYLAPFAMLRGEFEVAGNKLIPCRKNYAPLPWDEQGHPYFSGTCVYETSVNIDREYKKAVLSVNTRDVTELSVNGRAVGTKMWSPWEYDVTDYLTPGENKISLSVTGNYGNLLYDPISSGLTGAPCITLYN